MTTIEAVLVVTGAAIVVALVGSVLALLLLAIWSKVK